MDTLTETPVAIRYWDASYTLFGPSLDGAAIDRITAAWIAAVEAEGAFLAGGVAEVDAEGERLSKAANHDPAHA